MGQRGPKALPANVHMLRGNASKKPLAAILDEFRPEVEIPSFPSWIWPEAKKEWKRISVELERYGLISKLDRAALVLYCQAWGKWVWAERMISRAMKLAEQGRVEAEAAGQPWAGGDGIMVPSPNGALVYSHYWTVSRRSSEDVSKFLQAFGLSPSSRSRVSTSDNRQGALPLEAGQDEWNSL